MLKRHIKELSNTPPFIGDLKLSDLLSETQRADTEKQDRHDDQDNEVRPVFEKMRAAQNDRAHERNEISRGQEGAERVKNPGHRFARENEAGEKDTWQHERHRHLQRLHLILRLGRNEQAEAEQRKDID
jgi:hypothetical protein